MDAAEFAIDHRTPLDNLIDAEEYAETTELIDCDELGQIDPAAILLVLSLIVPQDLRANCWRIATIRLACLAHALLPELRRYSITKVADSLGISKSLFSHYTVQLRDACGLSSAGCTSAAGREVYAQRQRKIWQNKRRAI
jgi:hypothetical protein